MVKRELHAAAFFSYMQCRKLAAMGQRRIYLKEWRKFRGYTQEQVVNFLASLDDPLIVATGASLSRIENGRQIYNQRILEALADKYDCEPDELLGHNPFKEGKVIDFMKVMSEKQQAQAMAILEAIVKSNGTDPD